MTLSSGGNITARSAKKPVVRFAPSPNGHLHLGHAYSALMNYRFARRNGGRFLLRIEDIDGQRSKPEFVEAIFEDLAWLGIEWEWPVRRQSQHMADYRAALDRLAGRGLVYPCWCSRKDIREAAAGAKDRPHDPDGSVLYPGTCRTLDAAAWGERMKHDGGFALRLDMRRARTEAATALYWREFGEGESETQIDAQPELWGDAVLARKDIGTSYHMAVTVDDALQGVTDVIRGEDLYAATGLHRLLQCLLDLPAPRYRHHRLMRDRDESKLAKRAGTTPLRALRAQGASARDILLMIGLADAH